MPDPVTSRNAAARRPVAGPPLKTKAEKRAEAKANKARARAAEKRRRALSVAGAAIVVLAIVVGLAVWIGNSSSETSSATVETSASAAPTPDAIEPSAAPFPPVPAGADPALSTKPVAKAGTGKITKLTTTTLIQGTGAAVESGQTIDVNYVGVTYADGKEFDTSWKRKEAFSFRIGAGSVIKGWDQGLIGVKVGSRVQLDIPAALAYGENPTGGQPAGTLRFIVDVLAAS